MPQGSTFSSIFLPKLFRLVPHMWLQYLLSLPASCLLSVPKLLHRFCSILCLKSMAPRKIHDIDFCRRHIYDSFALTLRISTHSPHIPSLFSPHFPDRFSNKLFMRRTKFGGKIGCPSKKKEENSKKCNYEIFFWQSQGKRRLLHDGKYNFHTRRYEEKKNTLQLSGGGWENASRIMKNVLRKIESKVSARRGAAA